MIRRGLLIVVTVIVGFLLLARGQNPVAVAGGATVSGTVLSPSGEPVDGAEVIAATPQKPAWPNVPPDERDNPKRGAGSTRTDKAGRFTLTLPDEVGLIAVHHPKAGYAEVSAASPSDTGSTPVKLEPWCRIEGVLKIGAKPAPKGTTVSLGVFGSIANAARVYYGYDTTTDDEGRYVLDRVPAGLNQVKVRTSKTGSALDQYAFAEPGKPAKLDIGGKGRPVVGKLVVTGHDLKDLTNPDAAAKLYSNSHFRRQAPWPKQPPVDRGLPDQEREEAAREWRKTPEAFEQFKDQYRCNVDFQPDGSFRFDDVPPGRYTLTLTMYRQSGLIGVLRPEVEVPQTPAVPTDEPLDLGEVKIEAATEGL